MRPLALGLVLAVAGCAHAPALQVSADGRRATWRGQTWTAAEGMEFFQRGSELHLVSLRPEKPFRHKAEVAPDGSLLWPLDEATLELVGQSIVWRTAAPSVAALVQSGRLHPHEEHLHLTHRYPNADLQALYRAREDDSPLPPMRRQVAAAMLALLVEEKLAAGSDAQARASLDRLDRVLAKLRRGFEAGLPAAALADAIGHDFEIREDGAVVEIEGRSFRAGAGLRFAYCHGHFHVEDVGLRWAHPVEFGDAAQPFRFPPSPLFEAREGEVVALPGPAQWRALLDSGQIQMLRDHWHLTPRFADPNLERLRAAEAAGRTEGDRAAAREALFEVMRLKLDLSSEAAFDASVAAVREAAARAAGLALVH